MLIRPASVGAELILPLGSPRATAAAVHRYHDGRSARQRLQTMAAETLARLGKLDVVSGERTELEPFALIERLADDLDEPDLVAAITLGPRRRNRKPVLQLIRPDGSSIGFCKVGWSEFTKELVGNESTWLRAVEGSLPAGLTAPRVIFESAYSMGGADLHVVVSSPLHTPRLAHRRAPLSSDLAVGLARAAGSRNAAVADLPWLDDLRQVPLIDLDRLLHEHGDARLEVGLWHGDLTRWNTATTRHGGTLIWDWEFADDDRPIGFDLLHQHFESVRRRPRRSEADAVASVTEAAAAILDPLGQPSSAVLDLYLCELIRREARLRGEGWDPTDLGPLDTVAASALRQRLR